MKLPNGERAVVDIRKLREYCLNSQHPCGRNKARVFASVGIRDADAEELKSAPLGPPLAQPKPNWAWRMLQEDSQVRSTWVVRVGDNLPRLTSCYVL